jgi:hypothetical protein
MRQTLIHATPEPVEEKAAALLIETHSGPGMPVAQAPSPPVSSADEMYIHVISRNSDIQDNASTKFPTKEGMPELSSSMEGRP